MIAAVAIACVALCALGVNGGILQVQVLDAFVPDKDYFFTGDSDAYVAIRVNEGPWILSTEKEDTNMPVWHETLKFNNVENTATVDIVVWDKDFAWEDKIAEFNDLAVYPSRALKNKISDQHYINVNLVFQSENSCQSGGGCGEFSTCIPSGDKANTCMCKPNYRSPSRTQRDCVPINPCEMPYQGYCKTKQDCVYTGPNQNICKCPGGFHQPQSSKCLPSPAPNIKVRSLDDEAGEVAAAFAAAHTKLKPPTTTTTTLAPQQQSTTTTATTTPSMKLPSDWGRAAHAKFESDRTAKLVAGITCAALVAAAVLFLVMYFTTRSPGRAYVLLQNRSDDV